MYDTFGFFNVIQAKSEHDVIKIVDLRASFQCELLAP